MLEEKYFKQVIREEELCFVNFGGKFLRVKVHDMGYDYVEVEVIDPDESPEVVELKERRWVVHFTALKIQKKR